jgi:hypothetical protein
MIIECKNCKEKKKHNCKGLCKICYDKCHYQENREKKLEWQKQYHLKNLEKDLKRSKLYHQKEENKKKHKIYIKQYIQKNAERMRLWRKQYRNLQYNNNPNFKLIKNIRRRILLVLQNKIKSAPTLKLLGCDIEGVWLNLEKQFKPGMTRQNYGSWHIDHKKPLYGFNLTDPNQQQIAFHYTNLQPLWAEDNWKKNRY